MYRKILFSALLTCYAFAGFGQQQVKQLWQPWYITPRATGQHLDLSGEWELSYLDSQITGLKDLSQRKDPFITTVPNSIHWSLNKAGKLPHPYYHLNSEQYRWTDAKVWYYSRAFIVPESAKEQYVFLCFDGIDYFSRVWLNDSLLGVHEGMFGGPNIEVSRFIQPGKENRIVVELMAGNWNNRPDYQDQNLPRTRTGEIDLNKRKGYNPRASGRIIKPWVISGGSGGEAFFSLGMWQGARLEIAPKIQLERPYLVTKSIGTREAILHLSAEVLANEHSLQQRLHPWSNAQIRHPNEYGVKFKPVDGTISVLVELVENSSPKYQKEFPLKVYEGRNWMEEDITIPDPKLWYPNGLGKPNLYKIRLSLKKDGRVIDKNEFEYGIRTIERVVSTGPRTEDNFENWQFVINGRKIFVKGMNFTPQDILLETSRERYRWTLSAAKEMGVQLIRIWGGGLLETNTLFELCNEMGIMVWQDFPIGNQDTPEYPQDIWEAQVVQNIFRLRNHPSLVIWCGGNEFNPYSYGNAMSIGILERNLRTFDPSRFFVRTTPDGGSIHVYPDMDPVWYNRSYGKEAWVSETGMHSMPEAGLFYETVDSKEFKELGRMWDTGFARSHPEFIHHFTEYGPGRVPRMLSRASHISDMHDPTIESVTEASQIGAGEFYQILSEKMQGNYPVTTGLMPWVFKRHWPVIAIQMMDWFGHAGAPYYFLKRTYEPTHIALDIPRLLWAPGEKMDLNLKVTNAVSPKGANYRASITVYDDRFKKLAEKESTAIVPAETAVTEIASGSFTIPSDYRDRFIFIVAELKAEDGTVFSRSVYFPRSLSKMEDKTFYEEYINKPIAWITLDKGPWLKPVSAATKTKLSVTLLSQKELSSTESDLVVSIKNTGPVPAFMTKVDVTGVKRAFYASDNFIWLQPGETKQITVHVLWRDKKDNAKLELSAWNASPVKVSVK
ncbi:glycoside hydrolase family 2 protein [Pollutibacter soli]|uniref:glycoside hydrolase family 2 protein n=1 Tax=Pollutibacter soli TaxID=3034157 RepID=UPI00301327D0